MLKSATDWMKLLLSTGEYADVYFLLVPAHKLILKNASDVFEAMFRFDSQNAKADCASDNCPVEIPDVEASAFKVMLSFIYAGDLSGLNGDNAMAVLYAAKKYNIPDLILPSLQIPISKLRNVFLAYAQARLFDLEDFAICCLSYIDKNADILIKSDEFLQIDQKLLCEILARDELQIPKNRRAVLGPALFKIRFPLLSKKEFLKIVPSKVLTAEEKFGVYQFQSQPNFGGNYAPLICPLKFPSHWRNWTFGTISMDIEKLSEFAREPVQSYRYSDETRTKSIDNNEKWLGIFLWCAAPQEENWSCKCSGTFRIVSQKCGVPDFKKKFREEITFNSELFARGFHDFILFAELFDPKKGFYKQSEDKVTLAIDVTVKEAKTGDK
ncbi:hypothetical protein niasHT_033808 [Heterodera trifolii]|uniref:BTB domain-containing protein n=1 Tax=Heterodera trifolii TaxID=157864 RepID=A0ABD2J7E6_9BILA